MDPDIRFPECEKQYGCGVEYIRADLVADVVAELCRDELIELICKAIGGGEKVGMVDFHVAEAIADALLARPSPDAIISAALERAADEVANLHCCDGICIHLLNTPETRAAILADAMKGQNQC
jgi:hypothetical protein